MRFILITFSMIIFRCCWGPSDYQLILNSQKEDSILKELEGTYQIISLEGEDVKSKNLKISFQDNIKQITGFSGCNQFFGSYSFDNNSLKFGALGATKMLCNIETNTLESDFQKAIQKTNQVFFTKEGLAFYRDKKLVITATKEEIQEPLTLEYMASSRGLYKQIIINNKTISTYQQRGGSVTQNACKEENWNTLTEMLESIDIENLPNVQAPSKAFQYDGAAIAHLKITKGKKTYESTPFDHGNPPEQIAELVKEILSISENIE